MGMFQRVGMIVKSKFSKMLDEAENPEETLDYSYEQQMQNLQKVKRGVVQMVTAKKRIEQQADKVQASIARLSRQAEEAVAADREDLARLALQRKHEAQMELDGLNEQIAGLEEEQSKLTEAEARLTRQMAAFKSKKETIKAQYAAAQASVRIGEAVGGISEEMGDAAMAMQRAENKTEQMRAKAGAIDELVESGVLDGLDGPKDEIEAQLRELSANQGVESELAAIKARAGKDDAKASGETGAGQETAAEREPVGAGDARN